MEHDCLHFKLKSVALLHYFRIINIIIIIVKITKISLWGIKNGLIGVRYLNPNLLITLINKSADE